MNLIKILNLIAVFIQFFGALLMYLNSPINQHIVLYTREENQKLIKRNHIKNKRLKQGFLLLTVGLLISVVATILS